MKTCNECGAPATHVDNDGTWDLDPTSFWCPRHERGKPLPSNVPSSLPETLDELATLMRTCIELGYRTAVENATAEEDDGHITNNPYIDWFAADKRLQEILAKTR